MNTDMTWFSFPTFLGLPQEIQSRNDDYAAVVYDKKGQAPLLLTLTLLANAYVATVAVCNLTDGKKIRSLYFVLLIISMQDNFTSSLKQE